MATKKATPKGGATKAAPKKAAPKRVAVDKAAEKAAPTRKAAAPKAAAAKAAAPKAADRSAEKAAAPKAAGAKKAAPKKAPAVKLSDAQTNLLKEIAGSGETGVPATKRTQKTIDALQAKKLIKRGKKEGDFFKYHVSKVGEKHLAGLDAAANPA
jgi:hypothetical protein